jgi:hypothetical protein
VIERRSCPRRGGVAGLTSCGERRRCVVGVIRPLVIGLVTAITVGWEARIVVVYVATGAGHAGMSAGEWKWSVVVIECALSPGDGVVAHLAGGRKPELNVIDRRQSIVEVILVASQAGCAREAVVVIDVARSASHANVCAGQRETGRGVIECRACPRRGRVADGAVGGKRRGDMTGVRCALEIGLMTADTSCVGQVVVIIDVAGGAGHAHVRSSERESGQAVIEGCVGPRRCRMACLAVRGKTTLDMVGVRRALEIPHVTGGAGSIWRSQIVVVVHMAGSAGDTDMRAGERESGGAVVEVRFRPGIYSVTGLARCGEAGRNVIRRNSILEIPQVAGIALGR